MSSFKIEIITTPAILKKVGGMGSAAAKYPKILFPDPVAESLVTKEFPTTHLKEESPYAILVGMVKESLVSYLDKNIEITNRKRNSVIQEFDKSLDDNDLTENDFVYISSIFAKHSSV